MKADNNKQTEWNFPFDIIESWNVETYFGQWIVPRLNAFIKLVDIQPAKNSPKVLIDEFGDVHAKILWIKYLKEMLFAFSYYSLEYRILKYPKFDKAFEKRISRGIHLFARYYKYLYIKE